MIFNLKKPNKQTKKIPRRAVFSQENIYRREYIICNVSPSAIVSGSQKIVDYFPDIFSLTSSMICFAALGRPNFLRFFSNSLIFSGF